jgi:hypothetical protein
MSITASEWRPYEKNTLLGFLTLKLEPSGLVLREYALHEKAERRWIALPSKPQVDSEGRHRVDPSTGKKLYFPVVEITGTEARRRFQEAALAAVDSMLGETSK